MKATYDEFKVVVTDGTQAEKALADDFNKYSWRGRSAKTTCSKYKMDVHFGDHSEEMTIKCRKGAPATTLFEKAVEAVLETVPAYELCNVSFGGMVGVIS